MNVRVRPETDELHEVRESLTRLIHFDRWGERDEQRASELFEPVLLKGAQE